MGELSMHDTARIRIESVQTEETERDLLRNCAGPGRNKVVTMPFVNPGICESILAQVCIFGKTCGQVARQVGLERHTVETVLIQELSKQAANEYRRGYMDGRKPSPPASALRPQLARRAAA